MNELADRAKRIKTRATVNEDPTEKLVRDLKSENQRIKKELSRGTIDPQWLKTNMNGRPSNPQGIHSQINIQPNNSNRNNSIQ
jgi:hypothetical protein